MRRSALRGVQIAGRAGVIQMDVRQQQRARPHVLEQRLDARCGPRIDHRAAHVIGADHAIATDVHDVDQLRHEARPYNSHK